MTAVRAAAAADVPPEGTLGVVVNGLPVCLARAGGRLFAISDVCSHADVPLSEGDVYDGGVECFLHGSVFDLATGKPSGSPATRPVATYLVTTVGDDVLVDTTQPGADA